MSITLAHVSKYYNEQAAVNNVNFSIQKGEIVGFLGPNGAGKSTTMKMITGFLTPTAGTVEVCGLPMAKDAQKGKQKIGYLPEQNPLYTDLHIKEFLTFTGKLYGLKGEALRQSVAEMMEKTGLMPEKNKKISQLSKGYRQRVGLAAALIHTPEVLILDEPTTGLDPNQIIEIRELIRQEGKDKTVMLSTHIMQEVEAICSRIIIINKGEIVADKPMEAIGTAESAIKVAGTYVYVEFSPDFKADSIIPFFADCNVVPQPLPYRLLLESKQEDIRPLIIKASAENGWPLVEIKLLESTMEDTFRKLTQHK